MDTPWYQYCRAVLEDGHSVVSFVTTSLYKGGNRRPDVYMIDLHGHSKYQSTFTAGQQAVIEKYPYIDNFSISNTSASYDIPLHYLLQQHVCGLAKSTSSQWTRKGTLENLLTEVFDKWKTITKGYLMKMEEQELILRLKQLEGIYLGILDHLENLSGDNLDKVKAFIKSSLRNKQQTRSTLIPHSTSNVAITQGPSLGSDPDLAVGRVSVAGAGAGALLGAITSGVGHALFGSNNENDDDDNEDNDNDEEKGGGLGKSMTSGAAVGAVVGGIITAIAARNFKNM